MSSNPTSKRRRKKQQLKERYAKVREDAQLADIIPTTPEGAVRNEVVLTGNAVLPDVVREALRENWATPDAAKPAIVANLLEPFFAEREIIDGKVQPPNRAQLIELAKVLRLLDQTQFERDHPEDAGKAKGGAINILQATQVMREALVADPAAEAERAMELTKRCFAIPESQE
jgi:hypothetical protein